MAGLVDNVAKFMGYLDKTTSNGSLYTGVTLRPMKFFKDNFQILSIDYENYAIVYTCTYKTAMYNRDDFTILVRNLEDAPQILETVKEEFQKLFQNGEIEPEQDVFKTPEVGDGEQEPETQEAEDEFLKVDEELE